MEVVTPGHVYKLPDFEHDGEQTLCFINKKPKEEGSKELIVVNQGTSTEEVLEVLIDRMNFLNGLFPCRENAVAITHLDTALLWMQKRTADRVKRNVKGTNQK